MKKKKLLSVLMAAAALSCSLFAAVPVVSQAADATGVTMYRLFNPNSGEHLFTSSSVEKDVLVPLGWTNEGTAWTAPSSSSAPVYRLFNPNSGEHFYTISTGEKDILVGLGWNEEGISCYSDGNQGAPIYRLFNPGATGQYAASAHLFTKDLNEKNTLIAAGWNDEGIGWYATGDGTTDPSKEPDDDTLKIGDIVILGTYEQDNDLTNGAEPIEWQYVADRDGHKLLLSKYALDNKKCNETNTDITWENCTLRSWINNVFYNAAFSVSDKEKIVTAHNENPDFLNGAKGGNATDDKVFLLSWTEARDYLGVKKYDYKDTTSNQKALCKPTAYAVAQGAWTYSNSDNYYPSDTVGCCWWWLRSPGSIQNAAAYVSPSGALNDNLVNYDDYCVRPAILID